MMMCSRQSFGGLSLHRRTTDGSRKYNIVLEKMKKRQLKCALFIRFSGLLLNLFVLFVIVTVIVVIAMFFVI